MPTTPSFASWVAARLFFSSAGQSDEYVESYTLRTNTFGVYVRDQWQALDQETPAPLSVSVGKIFLSRGKKGRLSAYYDVSNKLTVSINCGRSRRSRLLAGALSEITAAEDRL